MSPITTPGSSQPPFATTPITFENILFGAIALNLYLLSVIIPIIAIPLWVMPLLIDLAAVLTRNPDLIPKSIFELFFVLGFIIVAAALVFNRICIYAARGFITPSPIIIMLTGLAFLAYGVESVLIDRLDGYIALSVTLFTAVVIVFNHTRSISQKRN